MGSLAARARSADLRTAEFSLKCFASAMFAYYIALKIGLQNPYWALTTCYITVSPQPLAGAIMSKAIYRVCGTLLGGIAAVVLLPQFVNAPLALSAALALWLGLCVYLTSLDRTPRSYAFALAGATAGIIAFPSVGSPGNVFNVAILRVQEILIGILCTTFVHGAILPRTLTARMRERVAQIVLEVEEWSTRSLAGQRDAELDKTRGKLALEINELETFAIQLPFDTARLLPDIPTLNALQDQLTVLLAATNAGDHVLLRQNVRALHAALISDSANGVPRSLSVVAARARALHRDRFDAMWTGLSAALVVFLACLFWIATAWPAGATALVISGLVVALFGPLPNAPRIIRMFLIGNIGGIVVATLYGFVLLPRVTDPVMYCVILAPALLLFGMIMARPPPTGILGLAAALGFINTVGFAATYQGDFEVFANSSLATCLGTAFTGAVLAVLAGLRRDLLPAEAPRSADTT